ncbi:LysR family transcriptional regulator [Burkholderia cenocepacia]|uniref:LysR family transcriptional regulator n=2 Tax=Burkholderia cepacia complex TaxID=87882 RepID=A0A427P256_9BURK|nr:MULTISPECIES: LysR family transcriptional regulator [Burkholderia cepacia complex]ELW9449303.1 LysR family transcriptional regulator [Burkholderia cenocepacia]MBR8485242.1 LysR family transcriptional regulator [Burkholderia cenocepacia]MDN7470263.1 LysR family transcriptional regulator [Burkholderia orbicola]MDN7506590.1 LysR family transcriptional regulator [Burkholderia orbicola]MDN7526078.1 LysR family transcriptional regulator [Burkholderia orbicola]
MDDFLSPHLALFVDVVDQQSFSAAARRLGVAASSVTRRIDRLETQLGIRLLHRTTHALRPTEAGQLLYGRATRMLAELRGLQEDLHSQHDEPGGLLRIDCPAPFGRRHLMAALAAFMQRYPALQVDLVLTDSMVDLQGARLGSDVDLAVRIGPLEDTRFVATVLAPQRRVLCASAAYLARCGEPASPDALAGHDCLAWHGAPPPGAWRFGERRHVPAQPRFRSNHSEALLEAAIDGLGLAHLPTWLAADALRDGRLRALLPQYAAAPEPATIHVLRQQARGSARTSRLVAFLATWFAQPAWDAAWA